MTRYRAVLAYDGTNYQGFQRLTDGRLSIQGMVEAAIAQIANERVEVIGAGRTDAGVHATGQVIAFDLEWRHSEGALMRAINAALPKDIVLLSLEQAAPGFHPRFDARSRAYQYRVYEAPVRQPMLDRLAWMVRDPLNVARMNEAAALLIGVHDFASFGAPPLGERGTTRRTVFRSVWAEHPPLFGVRMLVYEIEADAFLYKMVRSIVGSLVEIGAGRMSLLEFDEAFRACRRAAIRHLAPPCGLTLAEVSYAGRRPPEQIEQERIEQEQTERTEREA